MKFHACKQLCAMLHDMPHKNAEKPLTRCKLIFASKFSVTQDCSSLALNMIRPLASM